jgi:hypothetical protein
LNCFRRITPTPEEIKIKYKCLATTNTDQDSVIKILYLGNNILANWGHANPPSNENTGSIFMKATERFN